MYSKYIANVFQIYCIYIPIPQVFLLESNTNMPELSLELSAEVNGGMDGWFYGERMDSIQPKTPIYPLERWVKKLFAERLYEVNTEEVNKFTDLVNSQVSN